MLHTLLAKLLCRLLLLFPCLGTEVLRNLTLTPGSGAPPDSSVGRVLLYFTAVSNSHTHSDHLGDLYHLWPVVLRKNQMLRSSDIIIYFGIDEDSDLNKVTWDHVRMSAEAFPNKLVRVFFVKNIGYQEGAIEGMLAGARHRWFEGYDW